MAHGAYQFVVGDDLDTLRDEHASGAEKFLAIVDLSSNALLVVPVFGEGVEAAKFAFKGAVEVGTRAAARELTYDEARELALKLARRGVRSAAESCALCFPAGTRVSAPHGARAIQTLHAGDQVLAENPKTGTVEAEALQAVAVEPMSSLIAVDLSDGSAITVTANHSFWVDAGDGLAQPGWFMAGALQPGDVLRTATGTDAVVEGLRRGVGHAVVYTLTVAKDRTFFVGQAPDLVHDGSWRGRIETGRKALL